MTHDDMPQRTDDATRIEELAGFLLARLDDDETAAQSALLGSAFLPFESLVQASDHGARHGPLRVLREVEAKRMGVLGWLEDLRAEREGRPATGPDVAEALVAASRRCSPSTRTSTRSGCPHPRCSRRAPTTWWRCGRATEHRGAQGVAGSSSPSPSRAVSRTRRAAPPTRAMSATLPTNQPL